MMRGLALLLFISVMLVGCTNGNQTQQQGTKTQQAQKQSKQAQKQPRHNAENRIQIAKQSADRITKLSGIRQAHVLVTKRNAYVAAVVDANQGKLTPELEKQIAQQVRATDPHIQNVYVSTNPEFVDSINRYVTDMQQGRPVAGFFEEFNEMVQRVFPNRR